jgi:hypothetical protein
MIYGGNGMLETQTEIIFPEVDDNVLKQYTWSEITAYGYSFKLYHDGKKIGAYKIWEDEYDDFVDFIESKGYVRGFVLREIMEAAQNLLNAESIYDHRLANQIKEKDNG